jgi:hypothetical protein
MANRKYLSKWRSRVPINCFWELQSFFKRVTKTDERTEIILPINYFWARSPFSICTQKLIKGLKSCCRSAAFDHGKSFEASASQIESSPPWNWGRFEPWHYRLKFPAPQQADLSIVFINQNKSYLTCYVLDTVPQDLRFEQPLICAPRATILVNFRCLGCYVESR